MPYSCKACGQWSPGQSGDGYCPSPSCQPARQASAAESALKLRELASADPKLVPVPGTPPWTLPYPVHAVDVPPHTVPPPAAPAAPVGPPAYTDVAEAMRVVSSLTAIARQAERDAVVAWVRLIAAGSSTEDRFLMVAAAIAKGMHVTKEPM